MTTLPRLKHVIVACSVLLLVPLAVPLLTGRVFAFNDLVSFHLPLRFLYQQALQSGDSTLWTGAIFSGFNVFGEGQVGMAHPFHYVLYRNLPLGVAFNLEVVASYVLALVGTRLLLRRLEISVEASWFGAMLFAFSGSTLRHLMHVNAVAIVAHMPWMLLAMHVLVTTNGSREMAWAFAATVGLLTSQLLLGHPQYVWICFMPTAILACVLVVALGRWRRLPLVGAAICLGLLGGAVQWLPTLDVLRTTNRLAFTPEARSQFSLRFWYDGLNALAPQRFPVEQLNEQTTYSGAFVVVALVWVALRWRAMRHQALVAGCVALAGLGALLSLGLRGGLFEWLAHLPGISSFRVPSRHMVLVHFALSGLGAMAFEDLIGLVRRRESLAPWRLLPLVGAPVAAIAAILSAPPPLFFRGTLNANLAQPWPYVCFLLVVTLLVVLAARRRPWAPLMLVPLVAFDLGVWGYGYIYHPNDRAPSVRAIDDVATGIVLPTAAQEGDVLYRPPGGNGSVLRGMRMTTGYVGLNPVRRLDPADALAQRLAGVKWGRPGEEWVPVSMPMPRARLVSEARLSVNVVGDLPGIDIARIALIETAVGALSGTPGDVSGIRDRPGSIEMDTVASGSQLLIVTERFDQGWKATVDGRPTGVLPAYGEFLACEVPPGRHHIAFTFSPDSFTTGRGLSLIALVATLGVTLSLSKRPPEGAHSESL